MSCRLEFSFFAEVRKACWEVERAWGEGADAERAWEEKGWDFSRKRLLDGGSQRDLAGTDNVVGG